LKDRPAKLEDVEIWGFPKETHYKDNNFIYPLPSRLNLPISDITVADRATFEKKDEVDSINYRFVFKHPPPYAEYFGYPGSPVFFTDMNTGEKTIQGIFMQVTRDSATKILISLDACKIENAIRQIDSILSKTFR